MKKLFAIAYSLLAINCSAQMQPADSLTGTYVGKSWYCTQTPWTITNDTTYVTLIDTLNCTLNMNNHFGSWGGGRRLYTRYYSCDTVIPSDYTPRPSIYWYTLFHSGDSLTDCEYSIPQPMPYPHYYYYFYGKRISHYVPTTAINELKITDEEVSLYPNPASTIINLTISQFGNGKANSVEIINMLGECVHRQTIKSSNSQIDVSDLAEGIYNISISSNEGMVNKRVVIVR